jgi:hypothetical protein
MSQFSGRIDNLSPQPGLRPVLRIGTLLKSGDSSHFDLISITCRGLVSFSERGRMVSQFPFDYIGEAYPEWGSRTILGGMVSSLTFLLPVDFDLLGDIEERRSKGDHDVDISVQIMVSAIGRRQDGTIGTNVVAGDVMSDTNPGAMQISKTVAKSDWADFLKQWQYSDTVRNSLREIGHTIAEAQNAKREAEEAAKAAKQASELTAVTALAEAYSQEVKVLEGRSKRWAVISLVIALVGGATMAFYVKESWVDKFTVAEALIRATVIAAVFGAFTLCLRIYEAYQHLAVVNRHRVNIGRTFEAFKAAQPTDRAKEIMAAVTAENMLAFGKSGFGGKDSPNQGPLAGATELIKAILDKPGH